jgi:hypothetical protein
MEDFSILLFGQGTYLVKTHEQEWDGHTKGLLLESIGQLRKHLQSRS